MSELCAYDPTRLITGILGGAKGTTRDTFELLHQASSAGARVALFGRKINQAEAPLELVRLKTVACDGAGQSGNRPCVTGRVVLGCINAVVS